MCLRASAAPYRVCKGVLVSGVLSLLLIAGTRAQGRVSSGSASLSGELMDTVSHLPVRRASICELVGRVVDCRQADSLGRFVYAGLSAGEHMLTLSCDNGSRSLFRAGKLLHTLRLTLSAGEQRTIRLFVDATGCDQRPFEVRTGEFRGHYSSGFELSEFLPCPGTAGSAAWVELTDGAQHQEVPRWPVLDQKDPEYRVYVRWIGTIQGPYRYGHMSLASYELSVDSVIEVRAPTPVDCPAAGR